MLQAEPASEAERYGSDPDATPLARRTVINRRYTA